MGCQGDIYVIYGIEADCKVLWEAGEDQNPVIYSVNGHTISDAENLPVLIEMAQPIEFYNGVQGCPYGPIDCADHSKRKLTTRVLGHSPDYTSMNMGSRHFKGKCLVGYAVGNSCYINASTPLPSMDDIKSLTPGLIAQIKEKLGLDVSADALGCIYCSIR